jgi:hypothetical protein
LAAGPIFVPGANPFWHVHELAFHSSLGPGPSPVFFSGSRTRVLSFLLFFRVVRRRPSGLGLRCRVLFSAHAGFRAAGVLIFLSEAAPLPCLGSPCVRTCRLSRFFSPTTFARRRAVRVSASLGEPAAAVRSPLTRFSCVPPVSRSASGFGSLLPEVLLCYPFMP